MSIFVITLCIVLNGIKAIFFLGWGGGGVHGHGERIRAQEKQIV